MNFRHKWASGVEIEQLPPLRLCGHRFGYAMRRKDHAGAGRSLVQLVDEHGAHVLEALHDEAVMNDLVAYIDGRSILLKRQLHDANRAIHTSAETSGCSEQKRQPGLYLRLPNLCRTSHESPASIQSRALPAPVEKGARTGEKSSTESRLRGPSSSIDGT